MVKRDGPEKTPSGSLKPVAPATAKIHLLSSKIAELQTAIRQLSREHREELAAARKQYDKKLRDERNRFRDRLQEVRDQFDDRFTNVRELYEERYLAREASIAESRAEKISQIAAKAKKMAESREGLDPYSIPEDQFMPAPPNGLKGPLAIRFRNVTLGLRKNLRRSSVRTAFSLFIPWISRHKSEEQESSDRIFKFNDLSFRVAEGERIAVIGPPRSGKSTLLRLMAGIFTPDSGSVRTYRPVNAYLTLGTGFMPQMTVAENAVFNLALHRNSSQQSAAVLDSVLEFAGLAAKRNWDLYDLEPSEKRQLSIACALQTSGDILIFDGFPITSDPVFTHAVLSSLRRRLRTRTLVVAGNSLQASRALQIKRALLLDKGQLCFDGQIDEAFALLSQKLDNTRPENPFTPIEAEEDTLEDDRFML